MKPSKPRREEIEKLISEVEVYLDFWAIAKPIVAPPRVQVNSRRMVRRINAYGMEGS